MPGRANSQIVFTFEKTSELDALLLGEFLTQISMSVDTLGRALVPDFEIKLYVSDIDRGCIKIVTSIRAKMSRARLAEAITEGMYGAVEEIVKDGIKYTFYILLTGAAVVTGAAAFPSLEKVVHKTLHPNEVVVNVGDRHIVVSAVVATKMDEVMADREVCFRISQAMRTVRAFHPYSMKIEFGLDNDETLELTSADIRKIADACDQRF